jgi:hypothetical protein
MIQTLKSNSKWAYSVLEEYPKHEILASLYDALNTNDDKEWLTPFLSIIRSSDTNSTITYAALTVLENQLTYDNSNID